MDFSLLACFEASVIFFVTVSMFEVLEMTFMARKAKGNIEYQYEILLFFTEKGKAIPRDAGQICCERITLIQSTLGH